MRKTQVVSAIIEKIDWQIRKATRSMEMSWSVGNPDKLIDISAEQIKALIAKRKHYAQLQRDGVEKVPYEQGW